MNAAAAAAEKSGCEKIVRSSIGARAVALDQHEQRQEHGRGDQAADHERLGPTGDAALGDAEHESGEPDQECERAGEVEAFGPPSDR